MQDNTKSINGEQKQLIGKDRFRMEFFEESSRPSKRWLDYQIAAKRIPFIKIGAKIFFDPAQVREALAKKNTVQAI